MSNFNVLLGERLRTTRQAKQLSVADVQRLAGDGFTCATISSYERGDRAVSVAKLSKLAHLYDVPLATLMPQRTTTIHTASTPVTATSAVPEPLLPLPRAEPGITLDLVAFDADRAAADTVPALRRYIDTINPQRRGAGQQRYLQLTHKSVSALAELDGTAPDSLIKKLEPWLVAVN